MVVLVTEDGSAGGRRWLCWWLRMSVSEAEDGCVGGLGWQCRVAEDDCVGG